MIAALRNPGMRDRHWEDLSNQLTFHVAPDESTTLSSFIELNMGEHIEMLQKVAESAAKEFQIESALAERFANSSPNMDNQLRNNIPIRIL